ncbi:MAG: hypothetical protein SFV15_17460 [Polyangiaceae bacterium]|nr:hypothetical protein [Polyangiaceae bacterium]
MVLAEYRRGAIGHCVAQNEDHYVLRLFGACDFVISRDLRAVEIRPAPEITDDHLVTWCCGIFSASLAILSGAWPLHASAVNLPEGDGLAFVGGSGAGKTTLAAACCMLGAQLVTDDVLVTQTDTTGVVSCYAGSTELRLRAHALDPSNVPSEWARRKTADGRLAVRPNLVVSDQTTLRTVVVPTRTGTSSFKLTQLNGPEAVLELAKFPRVAGWLEAGRHAERFSRLAAIARGAAVFRLEMPSDSAEQTVSTLLTQLV